MKLLLHVAALAAIVLLAAPAGAEGPLTPVKPTGKAQPSSHWVEPPPQIPQHAHEAAAEQSPGAGQPAAEPRRGERPQRMARRHHYHHARRHHLRLARRHHGRSYGYYAGGAGYAGMGPPVYSSSGL